MREIRPYGSEGGEAKAFPTPIRAEAQFGLLESWERGHPARSSGCRRDTITRRRIFLVFS